MLYFLSPLGQGAHSRGHLPVSEIWPPLLHRGRLRWTHHVQQQRFPPGRPQLQRLSSEMEWFWDSWWGGKKNLFFLLSLSSDIFFSVKFEFMGVSSCQGIHCTTDSCQTWAILSGATSLPWQEATEEGSRQVLHLTTDTVAVVSFDDRLILSPHSRHQSGFEILKQMLGDDQLLGHLPLADIWEWQVGVACRQTGGQRLKAIHLLLRLLKSQSQTWEPSTYICFSFFKLYDLHI